MWYNGIMLFMLRTPLHSVISYNVLSITYTGRKSGEKYTVPVSFVRDEEDANRVLITSTPARVWWRNLRGGQPITVRLRGQNRTGMGYAYEGDEVLEPWRDLIRTSSHMAAIFKIGMHDGEPDEDHLRALAPTRVMVELRLDPLS